MPTNLKSLLSRSRSKNELKLRESKDEISPSGNSGKSNSCSSSSSSNSDSCCSCESSGNHACLNEACCCRQSSCESFPACNVTTKAGFYLHDENDSIEDNSYPPLGTDFSSYATTNCKSDESPPDPCLMSGNYRKPRHSGAGPGTTITTTMIPSGSPFHNNCCLTSHNNHQDGRGGGGGGGGMYHPCCQNYTPATYDMMGPTMVAAGNSSGADYCRGGIGGGGYYLDEKSGVACSSRLVGGGGGGGLMMDQRDNVEMRRNASCKTLFFSCTTLHQPSCNTFEPRRMDSTLEFPPGSSRDNPSGTCNGNGAAVPSSTKKQPTLSHHHHQARTNVTDGCGSLAYGSPSAAYCVPNVKDGSPCQSLSLRKCETVLALSNFNESASSATTNPVTANSAKAYIKNPAYPTYQQPTYPNFLATGTTGATASHLSSSTAIPSSNVGGKVKVMKEKILSTSSSALNCLLHSSSRTGKLLSGWKLSSATNSSNSGSNSNVGHISNMFSGSSEGNNCLGVNCQSNKHFLAPSGTSATPATATSSSSSSDNNKVGSSASTRVPPGHLHHQHHHHHHKSRSQLSISENSFSSSPAPLTPVNRLRRNVSVNNTSGSFCPTSGSLSANSSYSRSSSVASFGWKEKEDPFEQCLECRLCLNNVRLEDTLEIRACSCRYCKDCLISYVSFEIQQGADEIACPDASCEKQGEMGILEVEQLVPPMLLEKHKKFKRFREVEKDSKLMWCPSPGCETVCQIQDGNILLTGGFVIENDNRAHGGGAAGRSRSLPFINCPTCRKMYCAECKLSWHPDSSCESFRRKLIKQGKLSSEDDELFSLDSIKKCPFCHVPIEKDSGCAQMMCKRCKHVFCWYCLASLDDDFLLRHYDKGPCKNKLGHSRASVVWHRAQVIGIFAGFGVLVLLASPLLILAAPCLLCCRCRYCANKLDPEESDLV